MALVATAPTQCQSVGHVVGTGGGSGGGGWISNDKLIEYAMNDVRNEAAALGATHVVAGNPSLGESDGTTTTATVTGTAYRCPPGYTEGAAVPTGGGEAPPPPPRPEPEGAFPEHAASEPTPSPPAATPEHAATIRAALDEHRDDILSCVAADRVALRATIQPDGTVLVQIQAGPGAPEEECVRAVLGGLQVENPQPGVVVHVLRLQ